MRPTTEYAPNEYRANILQPCKNVQIIPYPMNHVNGIIIVKLKKWKEFPACPIGLLKTEGIPLVAKRLGISVR
jgi:hypothetical protein